MSDAAPPNLLQAAAPASGRCLAARSSARSLGLVFVVALFASCGRTPS